MTDVVAKALQQSVLSGYPQTLLSSRFSNSQAYFSLLIGVLTHFETDVKAFYLGYTSGEHAHYAAF